MAICLEVLKVKAGMFSRCQKIALSNNKSWHDKIASLMQPLFPENAGHKEGVHPECDTSP